MLKFPVPYRRPTDRIAAVALYRALLSQASALTSIPSHDRNELQHLIRNRFRRARGISNTSKLTLYFSAGYETLDYLDAAVAGNASSTATVLSLLSRTPPHAKAPRDASSDSRRRGRRNKHPTSPSPSPPAPAPSDKPRISLFDRPLPLSQLSGPRHVPVLFNASHIPVLRLKKPQPKALTAYIVSRLKQRQSRHDRRLRLLDFQVIATNEDAWDEIVKKHGGVGESGQGITKQGKKETTWSAEITAALRDVEQALIGEREKSRLMAAKMQALVDRERELWEKEKAEAEAAAAAAAATAKG